MARITVEDCLTRENNRFALVQLASQRTKQILLGAKALIDDRRENKAVVTALREIAAGAVGFMTEEDLEKQREKELQDLEVKQETEGTVSSGREELEALFRESGEPEGTGDESSETSEDDGDEEESKEEEPKSEESEEG